MNKLPYIERPYNNIGLTGESAYLWALFIANEADMIDDVITYDRFKAIAEDLAPKPGKATPACVMYQALEDKIAEYTK